MIHPELMLPYTLVTLASKRNFVEATDKSVVEITVAEFTHPCDPTFLNNETGLECVPNQPITGFTDILYLKKGIFVKHPVINRYVKIQPSLALKLLASNKRLEATPLMAFANNRSVYFGEYDGNVERRILRETDLVEGQFITPKYLKNGNTNPWHIVKIDQDHYVVGGGLSTSELTSISKMELFASYDKLEGKAPPVYQFLSAFAASKASENYVSYELIQNISGQRTLHAQLEGDLPTTELDARVQAAYYEYEQSTNLLPPDTLNCRHFPSFTEYLHNSGEERHEPIPFQVFKNLLATMSVARLPVLSLHDSHIPQNWHNELLHSGYRSVYIKGLLKETGKEYILVVSITSVNSKHLTVLLSNPFYCYNESFTAKTVEDFRENLLMILERMFSYMMVNFSVLKTPDSDTDFYVMDLGV